MITDLLLFLNQNISDMWLLVFVIYLLGILATLWLVFAEALTLGHEPKGCSAIAVSCIMIPAIIVWPVFWLVVIGATFIRIRNLK